LPNDPEPFPSHQLNDATAQSFPSIFTPAGDAHGGGGDDSITNEELQHIWHRLNSLIRRALETQSQPRDVVEMVKEFYETNVRANFADAPEWLERDIYSYIYSDLYRQADAGLEAVNKTIEFLRTQVAVKNPVDDTIQPSSENIRLLLHAVKTHSQLVDLKRKRDKERGI